MTETARYSFEFIPNWLVNKKVYGAENISVRIDFSHHLYLECWKSPEPNWADCQIVLIVQESYGVDVVFFFCFLMSFIEKEQG